MKNVHWILIFLIGFLIGLISTGILFREFNFIKQTKFNPPKEYKIEITKVDTLYQIRANFWMGDISKGLNGYFFYENIMYYPDIPATSIDLFVSKRLDKYQKSEELEKYLRYYLEYYQGINPTIKWLENEL